MRMRVVPCGSLPVRSAVIVRGRPAGNPISLVTRTHFVCVVECRASTPCGTGETAVAPESCVGRTLLSDKLLFGTSASTYGAVASIPACDAAYIPVAVKYSISPCISRRRGPPRYGSPKSSVRLCGLANPLNGSRSKLPTYLCASRSGSRSRPLSSQAPAGGRALRLVANLKSGYGGLLAKYSLG